jgi:hypothetical protein
LGGVRVNRKTVQVPHDGPGIVQRVAEVWAAFVGRDGEVELLPTGWVHVANLPDGRGMYGWVGSPGTCPELQALAEALTRRSGKR